MQVSVSSALSFPARLIACAVLCLAPAIGSGCDSGGGSTGEAGAAGDGGGGAGICLREPLPTFLLKVKAQAGGPIPPDTTVMVHWSAGQEPPFHLDDPDTWPTLDTSSIRCDIDPPAPADLQVLVCALWTASPTEVTVSAVGYDTEQHTYISEPTDECNPEPTPIEVELAVSHE